MVANGIIVNMNLVPALWKVHFGPPCMLDITRPKLSAGGGGDNVHVTCTHVETKEWMYYITM